MSDVMGGMPPRGMPPRPPMGGPPQGGKDPMSANRSIMNPMDAAAMAQTGAIKPGMTIKDFLGTIGVTPEEPVENLVKAIKSQGQNQSGIGKVGAMAQGGGMPPQAPPMRRPEGRPPVVPTPSGGGQGLAALME